MNMYFQGFLIGLAYLVPIGVQNLFVINTALTQPFKRVLITALTVIFFDVSLALACFFGVGALVQSSELIKLSVLFAGSLVLIWIGASLIRSEEADPELKEVSVPYSKVVSTAFVVTWFNPQAIIDGSLMLGAFRASLPAEGEMLFAGGFVSASFSWFLSLSMIMYLFSTKFTSGVLRWINVVCGAVIILYGIKLFISFVKFLTI